MKRILNQKKIITFSILLISCAFDLAHVKYNPTVLVSCTENCPSFIIENDIFLNNLPCGYNRKIKKDSEWKMLGSIKEGCGTAYRERESGRAWKLCALGS